MPQDWSALSLNLSGSEPIPFTWYGENLWKAEVSGNNKSEIAEICATDYSGNKNCIKINLKAMIDK